MTSEAFDEAVRVVALIAVLGAAALFAHEALVHANQAYPTVYVGTIYRLEPAMATVRWTFVALAAATLTGSLRRRRTRPDR